MTPSDFNRRKRGFRLWLEARGATMLKPADRDLLRWSGGGKVSFVHRGKGDKLVFWGLAEEAWAAFVGKADWAFPVVEGAAPAEPRPPRSAEKKLQRRKQRAPYKLGKLVKGVVTAPGIYVIPEDDYHADPCPEPSLSNSGARLLEQSCPAIFWHRRLDPPPATKALQFGTAAHKWILEGEAFEARYAVLSPAHSSRSAMGKAIVEGIEARGQIPIAAADWRTIRSMKEAIDAHPFAAAAFANGRPEMSLFWQDERCGVWCRARPDYLPDRGDIIVDYMTARSVHPVDLRKALVSYGYDQKGEWLIRAARATGVIKNPRVAYVIQQSEPPYLLVVARLSATTLQCGRIKNDRAIALFTRCLRTGHWPGHGDEDVIELDLPEWDVKRLDDACEAGRYDVERILKGVRLSMPARPDNDEYLAEIAATP